MDYRKKYLIYKKKYLDLKSDLIGGKVIKDNEIQFGNLFHKSTYEIFLKISAFTQGKIFFLVFKKIDKKIDKLEKEIEDYSGKISDIDFKIDNIIFENKIGSLDKSKSDFEKSLKKLVDEKNKFDGLKTKKKDELFKAQELYDNDILSRIIINNINENITMEYGENSPDFTINYNRENPYQFLNGIYKFKKTDYDRNYNYYKCISYENI